MSELQAQPEKLKVELSPQEIQALEDIRRLASIEAEETVKIRALTNINLPCPPAGAPEYLRSEYRKLLAQGDAKSIGGAAWHCMPIGAVAEIPRSFAERHLKSGAAEKAGRRDRCTPLESWKALHEELNRECKMINLLTQQEGVEGKKRDPELINELWKRLRKSGLRTLWFKAKRFNKTPEEFLIMKAGGRITAWADDKMAEAQEAELERQAKTGKRPSVQDRLNAKLQSMW